MQMHGGTSYGVKKNEEDARSPKEKQGCAGTKQDRNRSRHACAPHQRRNSGLVGHYSADPERDPQIHPEWKQKERRTYSSQAAWDREQEMVDEAGGGELVFADTLVTYWNKIVITDPGWRPSPHW